uniref:G_PROTEIN_RECEP_F1_2 domain-containing protein n=1 Tax=Caenorhabditis tropicalis TaxID=1561998 RepID=A0A1I7V3Y0_9PELO
MRTSSTNIILIGIAISDILILGCDIQVALLYFMNMTPVEEVQCIRPDPWIWYQMNEFVRFLSRYSRRASLWQAVLLGLIRLIVIRNPVHDLSEKLCTPEFGWKIVTFVFILCVPLSLAEYLQYTVQPYKTWTPPVECSGFPENYTQIEYYTKENGVFGSKEWIDFEMLLDSILTQWIPCFMFLFTSVALIFVFRKHSRSQNATVALHRKAYDRVTKLVIVMTICFVVASAPVGVITFAQAYLASAPGIRPTTPAPVAPQQQQPKQQPSVVRAVAGQSCLSDCNSQCSNVCQQKQFGSSQCASSCNQSCSRVCQKQQQQAPLKVSIKVLEDGANCMSTCSDTCKSSCSNRVSQSTCDATCQNTCSSMCPAQAPPTSTTNAPIKIKIQVQQQPESAPQQAPQQAPPATQAPLQTSPSQNPQQSPNCMTQCQTGCTNSCAQLATPPSDGCPTSCHNTCRDVCAPIVASQPSTPGPQSYPVLLDPQQRCSSECQSVCQLACVTQKSAPPSSCLDKCSPQCDSACTSPQVQRNSAQLFTSPSSDQPLRINISLAPMTPSASTSGSSTTLAP